MDSQDPKKEHLMKSGIYADWKEGSYFAWLRRER
jgi:hypothetical protein